MFVPENRISSVSFETTKIYNNSSMAQSGFIAVIDLGTSNISGVIGRRNENNVISVLHHASLSSENSIRRGVIYNIEKAGAIVNKLIKLLENRMDVKIGKVYVSLGGQSVLTIIEKEEIKLPPESGMVPVEVIDSLVDEAKKLQPDLRMNYAVSDVEYFLDDKPELNPVGVTCKHVEAIFRIVVGRPNLFKNIQAVIEKSNVKIAGYIISAIASADIVLTDEEKDLGCAFIDMGAGTTDVVVYKGGILRHMVTIPFGGKNITRDIEGLNFVESDAESYKIKFGKAKDNNEGFVFSSPFSSPFSAKPDIDLVELNKVIVMRLDEITANIKEQIRISDYMDELGAGIVVSGGASQLKNIDLYLNQKFNMPVRLASARKNFVNNASELVADPSKSTLLGMLLKGKDNCELEKPKEPVFSTEAEDEYSTTNGDNRGTKRWGFFSTNKDSTEKKDTPKQPKSSKGDKGKFGDAMKDMFSSIFEDPDDN